MRRMLRPHPKETFGGGALGRSARLSLILKGR